MRNLVFQIRKVLLSTGELTDEVVITDTNGMSVYESCPAGSTTGINEADIRVTSRQFFLDTMKSLGQSAMSQASFDNYIKGRFGANVTTPLSLAYLRYKAMESGMPIYQYISKLYSIRLGSPSIVCNILNGGKHASNKLAMCEFMIIPEGGSIEEDILIASQVYLDLGNIINRKLGAAHTSIGREGGFAPRIDSIFGALSLIMTAINKRGRRKCRIAIDVAANNFCKQYSGQFKYRIGDMVYGTNELLKLYSTLLQRFPAIVYFEDPFHERDKNGWRLLMEKYGRSMMIVADDLTVSNKKYLSENLGLFNAVVLKTNQVGTFSGLMEAYKFCKRKNIRIVASQRSGETDSAMLSHLAVCLGNYMKAGAPARERIVKYNELLRIQNKVQES